MKQHRITGEPRPYLLEYNSRLLELYANRKEWSYYYKQLFRLRAAQNRAYRYLANDNPFLFFLFFILNLPLDIWKSFKNLNDYYCSKKVEMELHVLGEEIIIVRNQIVEEESKFSPQLYKRNKK